MQSFLNNLMYTADAATKRISSYDTEGRNSDLWSIPKGESKVLAQIKGPGKITHIWLTQHCTDPAYLRSVLFAFYWDDEKDPSILVPIGDFFCLGHSMVNSFQSIFFTASTNTPNKIGQFVALNCYLQMPFNRSARVEIINEADATYRPYFYIDYEQYDAGFESNVAYLHASFNRENPTSGWGHEITPNTGPSDIVNLSDKNNYVLLEAEGVGHFIGFNLSITNLHASLKNPYEATWWGEGDDMIFVDEEPWPPSLHGTGSEDALNQAFGMQPNAYMFNGSSIYEHNTGGYQTSYVFYVTNPIRFKKSIRASIEHGHGNHLSNEYSSVAYWYQKEPHRKFCIVPARQRAPLIKSFNFPEGSRTPPIPIELNDEMKACKEEWQKKYITREAPGSY